MSGDVHVQFCEQRWGKFPALTHLVIGITGSKQDAQNVMDDVTTFVEHHLKLKVSKEKSAIIHAKHGARFLGYDIKVYTGNKVIKSFLGTRHITKRSVAERIQVHIPQTALREFCQKKGYADYDAYRSRYRPALQNLSDAEIVCTYNAELRGFANYYSLAKNAKRDMNKLQGLWQSSLLKTLAAKHKSTVTKMAKKLRTPNGYILRVEKSERNRTFKLFNLKDIKEQPQHFARIDKHPNTWQFTSSHSELVQRLDANKCEYCGKTGGYFEVHHIRKLKDLDKGKRLWQTLMARRNRKTMVLCVPCHKDLHRGTLPHWRAKQ